MSQTRGYPCVVREREERGRKRGRGEGEGGREGGREGGSVFERGVGERVGELGHQEERER